MKLQFRYRNAKGEEQEHTLSNWKEDGAYLRGFQLEAGAPRTYLKFRVTAYHDGCERLLQDPFAPPPDRLARAETSAARRPTDERPQILFTGFPKVQRADLERRANESGLRVVKTVTEHLAFLCGGPNAGPSKVADARAKGVLILRQDELLRLCETGEMPDPTDESEL